jgi:hypothetical protein
MDGLFDEETGHAAAGRSLEELVVEGYSLVKNSEFARASRP